MEFETLKDIGLSDGEIKVYFALLELESSSVGPIIEKSKVPDSKIYSLLEKLKEKGLVSFVVKNNVKHFQASDPKNLLQIISDKEEEIAKQKKSLKDEILPGIEKRRKLTEDKQEAIVYESFEGVKAAYNLLLSSLRKGEEYQVFMLGSVLEQKNVSTFFHNFHQKRIDKGIRVRLLSERTHKTRFNLWGKLKGIQIKYAKTKLPVGTFIFKDHVMTVIWEDKPTAIVIKSKKNYEHYKEFFEDMWNIAKQ
jgi:HTH-type transcriptional regulator, sugar sensing transcriptional regulator